MDITHHDYYYCLFATLTYRCYSLHTSCLQRMVNCAFAPNKMLQHYKLLQCKNYLLVMKRLIIRNIILIKCCINKNVLGASHCNHKKVKNACKIIGKVPFCWIYTFSGIMSNSLQIRTLPQTCLLQIGIYLQVY